MNIDDYNKKLFEDIYAKYHDTVYKYILVSLGFDHSISDDCMQDVILLLLQKADKVIEHPNPGGFFIVTAKNYIKKYKTTIAANSKKITSLEENSFELSYEEKFEDMFEKNDDVELLKREILQRLDHNEMSLYEMFYERKLTISKISENLNISEGNVKVRLFRLRMKVKNMVRELFL